MSQNRVRGEGLKERKPSERMEKHGIVRVYMPSNHCSNWDYHEWLAEKHKGAVCPKEICVLCGVDTKWPTGLPIELRSQYAEGVGQLCQKCWDDTGGDIHVHPD